jgi:hypothetical protein
MKQKQQILVLIIIVILAVLIWAFYIKKAGAPATTPQPPAPVAGEDDGRYVPELNNTLETSVTVIAPTTPPPVAPAE